MLIMSVVRISVYGKSARAPIIDTLFGGHLVSSVECRTCHKVKRSQLGFSHYVVYYVVWYGIMLFGNTMLILIHTHSILDVCFVAN